MKKTMLVFVIISLSIAACKNPAKDHTAGQYELNAGKKQEASVTAETPLIKPAAAITAGNEPVSFDKELAQYAKAMNLTCPYMADETTRIDNVLAIPGNTVQVNASLRTDAEFDIESFRQKAGGLISNQLRADERLNEFRDHQVSLIYKYADMEGKFLHQVSITPAMYAR